MLPGLKLEVSVAGCIPLWTVFCISLQLDSLGSGGNRK